MSKKKKVGTQKFDIPLEIYDFLWEKTLIREKCQRKPYRLCFSCTFL